MRILSATLLVSGAVSLMYEVVWTRLFSQVLGSTALAMSIVFSSFLLCLAIGAYLGGLFPVRGARAIQVYGIVECAIGILAVSAGQILFHGRSWLMSYIPTGSNPVEKIGIALVTASIIIGPATLLMGATLPIVLNGIRHWSLPKNAVAKLYGWNTLGGAFGSLLTGFVLIWILGISNILYLAASLNFFIGIVAFLHGHNASTEKSGQEPDYSALEEEDSPNLGVDSLLLPVIAFASGFIVLGSEILWGRMTKFLLGDRTLSTSYLLFVFLSCLGIGSFLARLFGGMSLGAHRGGGYGLIAAILSVSAVLQMTMSLLANLTVTGGGLISFLPGESNLWKQMVIMWCLIAPPTIPLGIVFPFLTLSSRNIDRLPGRVLGYLYFINTVGAVVGAVTAAFFLSRSVGTMNGFIFFGGVQLCTAGVLILLTPRRKMVFLTVVAAGATFLGVVVKTPHGIIWLRPGEKLMKTREDEYGVHVMAKTQNDMIRVRTNRLQLIYDLGHPQTTHAQQMAAHLTVLLAKNVQNVINVGTGYGITAGTFTLYPDVEHIETVEILPFLVDQQVEFSKFNLEYYKDLRVNLVTGDGRHHLLSVKKSWDIISVNVLDPYLPGSSGLYTTDFWKQARSRLKPGGVYTQLFWGEDLPLLVRGIESVFPTVLYFPAYGDTSWNVVAFRDAVSRKDVRPASERFGPDARSRIRQISNLDFETFITSHIDEAWYRSPGIVQAASVDSGVLHSDEFPILEFRWKHGVRGVSTFDSPLTDQ